MTEPTLGNKIVTQIGFIVHDIESKALLVRNSRLAHAEHYPYRYGRQNADRI